jgi:3-oxoacyl-[acyl-carrier protein] reductase
MNKSETRRRAIVTGASSGIGAACARRLALSGHELWLTYASDAAGAERTARACQRAGAAALVSQLDLRSPESVARLVEDVRLRWGAVEALVNNGGVCPYTAHDAIDVDEWDLVLEVNARGTFLMIEELLPLLRAGAGDRSVVNVSSVAGEIGGVAASVHYAASKAAILAITRSFARLLAAEGIRVNAVAPGPIESAMVNQLSADRRDRVAATVPLRRWGAPEDVAAVVELLASESGRFITGATYDVNGGVRIDG